MNYEIWIFLAGGGGREEELLLKIRWHAVPNEVEVHGNLYFSFFKTCFLLVWSSYSVISFWSSSIFQRPVADEQAREGKN